MAPGPAASPTSTCWDHHPVSQAGHSPSGGGASKINGARFTPPASFESIYIASDPITSLTEVWAVIMLPNGLVPAISVPHVVISIEGIIHNLLDMTDAKSIKSLNTTIQEVTGSYATSRCHPHRSLAGPPTILAGSLASNTVLQGIQAD